MRFRTTDCFAFQTSMTGMPAMALFGSSCAPEFTVSFAPMTMATCVEITLRGASRPRPNHDIHAIDATLARWRGEAGPPDARVDFHTANKRPSPEGPG